jgi:ornithine cyclodeaminase/alanine dehydrogenase-like protein (mu-crystallin family)
MQILGQDDVRRHLTFDVCIPLMREAMTSLSRGETRQPLRSIVHLDAGRAFGVMPGALSGGGVFGAKLVSVYPDNFERGAPSHQGAVMLFDPQTGALAALVHAGEITRIRTAAASAAATDALARPEASVLTVLGYGEQAAAHVEAISRVRRLTEVRVWGRSFERAETFAARMAGLVTAPVRAVATVAEAARGADILCTTTASAEPVLLSEAVADGAHVNLVGSSYAGPVEVDSALVGRGRYFADYAEGVRAQGSEFLVARAQGVIDDSHLLGEIGQVFGGDLIGRAGARDVTLYKSLGHVVQDLAAARWLLQQTDAGTTAAF